MNRLILTAIFLFSANIVHAEQISCEFNDWTGARDDIGMSWTGEKVVLDTGRGLVQRGYSDGWAKPEAITQISKTDTFTTYTVRSQKTDDRGRRYNVTFSIRVYASGKGTARVSAGSRMRQIVASGNCR